MKFMAYKGINTYVQEMQNTLMSTINHYANLGVPVSVIRIVLDSALKDVDMGLKIELLREKEQYELEVKQENSNEEEV